jgi:hypothetical protein
LVRSAGLEAVIVILQAGILDADEPHGFVAGATVRDEDAELFQTVFQPIDGKVCSDILFLLV